MPDCEAIKFFFSFKITLDQIKLYTLYPRGKEWWIYTHQNAHFCLFLPKKCKRHPIYSITFTNVQLYRRNKSITTNLEQGLSNTTTRQFLFNLTNNLTLINCTYTTCNLQLFIWSKEAITTSVTGELYSFRWPHRPPPTHLHTQPNQKEESFTLKKQKNNKKKTQNH